MQEKLVFVTLTTFKQQNRLTFASTNASYLPHPSILQSQKYKSLFLQKK